MLHPTHWFRRLSIGATLALWACGPYPSQLRPRPPSIPSHESIQEGPDEPLAVGATPPPEAPAQTTFTPTSEQTFTEVVREHHTRIELLVAPQIPLFINLSNETWFGIGGSVRVLHRSRFGVSVDAMYGTTLDSSRTTHNLFNDSGSRTPGQAGSNGWLLSASGLYTPPISRDALLGGGIMLSLGLSVGGFSWVAPTAGFIRQCGWFSGCTVTELPAPEVQPKFVSGLRVGPVLGASVGWRWPLFVLDGGVEYRAMIRTREDPSTPDPVAFHMVSFVVRVGIGPSF